MKHPTFILFLLLSLLLGSATAFAQEDLDVLDRKVGHHLETKMPGWQHKRGEPIQGSRGVLIQTWSFPNRGVKIALSTLKTAEEARQSLQSFVRDTKEAEFLKGFGDEAYVWGYEGSDIVVRRGRHIVYINVGADIDHDPDARTLSQSEKRVREYAEIKRISREFAKNMVDALDLP